MSVAAAFTINYEIADGDQVNNRILYGQAATVLTPVELTTGRPRRLDPVEREVLSSLSD